MTRALAWPRPLFFFALAAAAALSAEVALVASNSFMRHRLGFSTAVVADLCIVLPALFSALGGSLRGALRLVVLGAAAAGVLLNVNLRLFAAPLELALIAGVVMAARKALRARRAGDPAEALGEGVLALIGTNPLGRAVAGELAVLWFALLSWGRSAAGGFSSHRRAGWHAVAFALGMVTLAEGAALHVLLSLKLGSLAATAGLALHAYGLLWLLGDARALALRRTTIGAGLLRVRIGLRWQADVPLAAIEKVELRKAAPGELALRVLGDANVVMKLSRPVDVRGLFGISRKTTALALQLDEPESITAAFEKEAFEAIG